MTESHAESQTISIQLSTTDAKGLHRALIAHLVNHLGQIDMVRAAAMYRDLSLDVLVEIVLYHGFPSSFNDWKIERIDGGTYGRDVDISELQGQGHLQWD